MSGKNEKIGGGGFHHVAFRSGDFDASIKFYTEGLGFVKSLQWGEGDQRGAMLDTGDGNYMEIFAGGTAEPKPEGILLHVAFRTNNCDKAINAARAAGAEVTAEPKDVVLGTNPPKPIRIAFCKGPDGELLEFFQEK